MYYHKSAKNPECHIINVVYECKKQKVYKTGILHTLKSMYIGDFEKNIYILLPRVILKNISPNLASYQG